jgi:ligand-binding sensor domain-containing protein
LDWHPWRTVQGQKQSIIYEKCCKHAKVYFALQNIRFNGSASSIRFIYRDKEGIIWIKNNLPNFYSYNEKRDTFIDRIPPGKHVLIPDNLGGMMVDNQEVFWFRPFQGGLTYFDKKDIFTDSPYPGLQGNINSRNISNILDISDSIMWLGTDGNGIYRYNKHTGKLKNETAKLADPKSLSSNKISSLFKDRQKQWMSTSGVKYQTLNYI